MTFNMRGVIIRSVLVLCLFKNLWAYQVMDPTGKWNPAERQIIQDCMEKWQHPAKDKHPPPPLTDKQSAWFYSLGCSNNTNHVNADDSGDRSREHTQVPHSPKRAIRKELRLLTQDERDMFNRAIEAMRNNFPDPDESKSEYEIIVSYHRHSRAPGAHIGPAFLPWHREYLWRFEMAMKQHEPDVAIPYWDATLDQPLPEPRESVLFSEHLIGNDNGKVKNGPYKNYRVIPECNQYGRYLTRELVANPEGGVFLYSNEDIKYVMDKRKVKDLMVPYDTKFEDDHGAAHVFVGGHMKDLTCAGNDPIFWMLHAFIDCVWEDFRIGSQRTDPELEYPTEDHEDYTEYHRPYHTMEPFHPLYNIHGMSNHYYNYYMECSPRLGRCRRDSDCDSEYLWCDGKKRVCVSKIRKNGNCTGLDDDACYGDNMECRSNKCQRKRGRDTEPESEETRSRDDSSNESRENYVSKSQSREKSDSRERSDSREDYQPTKSKSKSREESDSRENYVPAKSKSESRDSSASRENYVPTKSKSASREKSESREKSNSRETYVSKSSKSKSRSSESREYRGTTKSPSTIPGATSPEDFAYRPWHPYMYNPNSFYPSYNEDGGSHDEDASQFYRQYRFGNYFGRRRRRSAH